MTADEITELCSAGNFIAEIVISLDVLAKKSAGLIIGDQVECQREAIIKRCLHGSFRLALFIKPDFPWPPRRSDADLGQRRDPSSIFELLEKETALMILQPTRGTPPFEEFADGLGKLGYAEGRKIVNEIPDKAELRFSNRATTK